MARPLEFDREQALGQAIEVFADHGYEGSSTAELLARMQIGRQSLYGAFGDKRRLFLEALERYNARSVAEIVEALGAKAGFHDAVAGALLAFTRPGGAPKAGCMGMGSVTEFGRSDADVNALNDASARILMSALADRVRLAVAAGELGEIDPEDTARFLIAVRTGLKIAARGGAGQKELRATVAMALRALAAP